MYVNGLDFDIFRLNSVSSGGVMAKEQSLRVEFIANQGFSLTKGTS